MEIIIGRIFGRLRVVSRGRRNANHLWYICECRCPKHTIKEVRADHLRSGLIQSCGCLQREIALASGHHYQRGKKFGRLTVIAEVGRLPKRGPIYSCTCDCGKRTKVQGRHLRSGESKSCGCWYRATRKTVNFKHGKAPSSHNIAVYSCWTRERGWCFNPNDRKWKYYGGKGVKFLFSSFAEFYAHVGDKPGPGYWLMRKNSDGNFEPSNVEWVDHRQRKKGNRKSVALVPVLLSKPAMPVVVSRPRSSAPSQLA